MCASFCAFLRAYAAVRVRQARSRACLRRGRGKRRSANPHGGDGGEEGALVDVAELGREFSCKPGEALPDGATTNAVKNG